MQEGSVYIKQKRWQAAKQILEQILDEAYTSVEEDKREKTDDDRKADSDGDDDNNVKDARRFVTYRYKHHHKLAVEDLMILHDFLLNVMEELNLYNDAKAHGEQALKLCIERNGLHRCVEASPVVVVVAGEVLL